MNKQDMLSTAKDKISNCPFLIVAGTSKAGTTSLHDWLSFHPEIGSSKTKETRFFLSEKYPVPRPKDSGNNLSDYESYFDIEDITTNRTLLESTPDYLYGADPKIIINALPHSKIILALRDPTERFVSWYNYSIQRSFIDKSVSLKEFFEMQSHDYSLNLPIYRYALHQGNYNFYANKYKTVFKENLLILDFNDLANHPTELMKKVCLFANIDHTFYDNFTFATKNKSSSLKFPLMEKYYIKIRRTITFHVLPQKRLLSIFRKINKPIKRLMVKNRRQIDPNLITDEHLSLVKDFYKN